MTAAVFKDNSSISALLCPTATPTQKQQREGEKMGVTRTTSFDDGVNTTENVNVGRTQSVRDGGELHNNEHNDTLLVKEIKSEPPLDIDDTNETIVPDLDSSVTDGHNHSTESPKIRLTPTSKLLAATPSTSTTTTIAKRRFCCPYENCTKSYGKSSHLRSHLTWHSGLKPFVCKEPKCGKGFTRSDELNRHMRTHTGEKPFECKQCGKRFSRSDHLAKHTATHTKHTANLSADAELNYNSDDNSFTATHSDFGSASPKSRKAADSEPAAKRLKQTPGTSSEGLDYDGMHFMAALVECTNRRLMQGATAAENSTDITKETSPSEHVPLKLKLQKSENNCDYRVATECSPSTSVAIKTEKEEAPIKSGAKVLSAVDTMVHPINRDEDDNFDNTIMPEANALPFSSRGGRKPRLSAWREERPFSCSDCSKKFRRQDDLNRHVRTHTGEKPYACDECERRFNRSDHLKKHKNVHQKNR